MTQIYIYGIASLIILILIVIYFLRKESTNRNKTSLKEIYIEEKKKISEQEDESEEERNKDNNKESLIFHDKEEKSFDKSKKETQKNYRQKGKVPEHGKITKDNFKEFAGIKILIAEDNLINQKVLSSLLADSGIEVTMADDGQIALDILEKNSDFNIILMDAHMPRVDGFEATRKIRANPNYEHIVVVALSGDTAADDVKKMTDAGMQEHMEKPLKLDAFYDILYAYTKADISNIKSDFVEVIMTKELNGDKGLSVCGGDEEFYLDILNEFTKKYSDSHTKLHRLLENKDIKNADAMLLDIIGISANIGADKIKDIAQELKEAIKDIKDKSYVTLLNKYEKHLNILLQDIKDYKNL